MKGAISFTILSYCFLAASASPIVEGTGSTEAADSNAFQVVTFQGANCSGVNQGTTRVNGGQGSCVQSSNAGSYETSATGSCSSGPVIYYANTNCQGDITGTGTWSLGQCVNLNYPHGSEHFQCGSS